MTIPQFYRDQTKNIRGLTFQDKIKTVAVRCHKVARDCETAIAEGRDNTVYRHEFGAEHKICFVLIDSIKTIDEAKFVLEILHKQLENCDNTGKREALRYLITEIEVAIESSEQQAV